MYIHNVGVRESTQWTLYTVRVIFRTGGDDNFVDDVTLITREENESLHAFTYFSSFQRFVFYPPSLSPPHLLSSSLSSVQISKPYAKHH